jgi:sporulation integral membrane protein YlbJ
MNYIFCGIIILSLFLAFILKNKNIPSIMFLLLIVFLIIKNPALSVSAANDGINLWIFVVMPSLLPFFIINDMLISLKVPENLSILFSPLAKLLFNTSGYGAYVFIMSIFSGYPAGAKITSDLIRNKKISADEGQKILAFSSTSGPLFIIGVVGASLLKSQAAGYLLLIVHILGAFINGILFRFILNKSKGYSSKIEKPTYDKKSTSELLSSAITNSLYTGGLIGGYIILFSVIISLIKQIQFFTIISHLLNNLFFLPIHTANIISYFLQALFEISNGTKIISDIPTSMELKLVLLSFIIAFSGLSIIGQVSGIISKTKINLNIYIISKISHGIISMALCFISLKLNIFSVKAITVNYSYHSLLQINTILLILLLFIVLVLDISGSVIKSALKVK